MRGINSKCIDLIYLDPPFNSNRNYAAPIGSEAAGSAFEDTWTLDDIDLAWHGQIADEYPELYSVINVAGECHSKGMKAYLIMIGIRLLEMKRILKTTGSIYLHCDPTASHYLKLAMDAVFGKKFFKNEIIWCYDTPSNAKTYFPKKTDTIFWYSKSKEYIFNVDEVRTPYKRGSKLDGKGWSNKEYSQKEIKKGKVIRNWWEDITPVQRLVNENTHYPTQKPLKLLNRIIRASSKSGQVVFDPFCGCATACVAAEHAHRQWIGIDIESKAADLVRDRLSDETGILGEIIHRTDIPKRTDLKKFIKPNQIKHQLYGFQEGKCNGCQVLLPIRNLTIDHIVPQSKGGQNNEENLQLLCGACNSMKGDNTMEYLIAKLKKAGYLKQKYKI